MQTHKASPDKGIEKQAKADDKAFAEIKAVVAANAKVSKGVKVAKVAHPNSLTLTIKDGDKTIITAVGNLRTFENSGLPGYNFAGKVMLGDHQANLAVNLFLKSPEYLAKRNGGAKPWQAAK